MPGADPKTVLERIERLLTELPLDEIETLRAARDLERVEARLERREYQKTSFDGNVFDVRDRVNRVLVEVDFYCSIGKAWAALLREAGSSGASRVADVCPGGVPKIELALFYLGYEGEVVLLEKDPAAARDLERFIALFNPRFRIVPAISDVFAEGAVEPAPVVAANHVLDDLVLDEHARRLSISPADLYGREARLVELWRAILGERERVLEETAPRLARTFERLTAPGGTVLLVQYPSYIERLLDLSDASRFNAELLSRTADALVSAGFTMDEDAPRRALGDRREPFSAEHCRILRRRG